MTRTWLLGLLARRRGRLVAVAAGVAASVALIACLGSFLASAKGEMTRRATQSVAVDWQVQVAPGSDPAAVLAASRVEPGTRAVLPVSFATSAGLSAGEAAPSQTGAAVVVGLPSTYAEVFPGELRLLSGSADLTSRGGQPVSGLLAQQTASNLGARVGTTISVSRDAQPPLAVRVTGIVDLPLADTLFQAVGKPPGSQPSAPPDNVVLLGAADWHAAFAPAPRAGPGQGSTQVHVARDRVLPADPSAAYVVESGQARHLEAALAGGGVVGDNLGSALAAARKDSLYAQVLFLFLGLPGGLLAAALTATVASAGAPRRRKEQSLLRLRGARPAQVLRLAAAEAALVGLAGSAVGLGVAAGVGKAFFGSVSFGATTRSAVVWVCFAAGTGLLLAALVLLLPARRDLRAATVRDGRQQSAREARGTRTPLVLRLGLDLVFLLGAAAVYAVTSRRGYALVLAPEGGSSISVSYVAFAGPLLFWLGSGLLTWRLLDLGLRHGTSGIARLVRPMVGSLAGMAAAGASRRRRLIARAGVLAGLSLAFAVSTAVFNTTYQGQAEVDARLTNGADVAVTAPPGTVVPADLAQRLAAVPGVRSVEPLQHRYAYIGADLQDLFGVRPATIAAGTSLQDGYFRGGTATQLIATLASRPDSILVSSETVADYQLAPGDALTLRVQDTRSQATIPVVFHYAGVVTEFPTAPRDSFFVANADYVATATGNPAAATFLLAADGDPRGTGARVAALLGPGGPIVSDITSTRATIGSSLTSVNLAGLTRVELGFALALALASGGLVLGLGLAERRRDLAVVRALGGSRSQLRALVQVDTLVVTVAALLSGTIIGFLLAKLLVTVLSGVFDPAPESLAVPWVYLAVVAALITLGTTVAGRAAAAWASRADTSALRES